MSETKELPIQSLKFNSENISKMCLEKYGTCTKCNQPNTGKTWCQPCNSTRFRKYFPHWTSGNQEIDKFIQETQLEATNGEQVVTWIPYKDLTNIEPLAEGGYAKVFKANWLDGIILGQKEKKDGWRRYTNFPVVLKILKGTESEELEFLNEVRQYHKCSKHLGCVVRCIGITQNPGTRAYGIITLYFKHGDMRQHLQKVYRSLSWSDRVSFAASIAKGIRTIHLAGLVHRDLHAGNILRSHKKCHIGDLGLTKHVKFNTNNPTDETSKITGVMPYVAPEVLRSHQYTQKADIYSFAMLMYEIATGKPPFFQYSHDIDLALNICDGLRPAIDPSCIIPKCYLVMMKQCWDADPEKRPTAKEISETLYNWQSGDSENRKEIMRFDKISVKSRSSSLSKEHKHSLATYTSKALPKIDPSSISRQNSLSSTEVDNSKSELKIFPFIITPNPFVLE
ncbi:hypothetical protein G9A89_007241 [Geosiphon pyriformis]|nr:hypothetical protein G9A89_007241 [Geosiphon pyriformis]